MGDTRSIPSSEMIIEDLLENTDNKKNISKNTKNITTVFDEDIKDYDISKSEISITKIKEVDGQHFVYSIQNVKYKKTNGFILISENADNIIQKIAERENFIIRTAIAVFLVILIFSYVLNRYFLKPIKNLVSYTKIIKE